VVSGEQEDHGPLDAVVVVVTHNSEPVLGGLIESLPAACDGLRWALVVVDNASSDGSVELVSRLVPEAVVVRMDSNAGYAAAINAGVARSPDSRAVVVTNPDVRAPAGSVASLVGRLGEGVGIIGPRIVDEHGALDLSIHRAPTVSRAASDAVLGGGPVRRWHGETVNEPSAYEAAYDVDWLSGAFLVIDRRCHDELGGWDPSFFLYSEETDFELRARDAGWRVRYDPVCTVTHLGGESGTSPALYSLLTVNRVRLVRRRRGRAVGASFAAAVLAGELVRCVRSAEPTVHRAAVAALVHGGRFPPALGEPPEGWSVPSAAHTDETRTDETRPWICFSAQDWWYHNRAHSDFQLMRRVAEHRPVLFVNSIGMRMPAPGRSTQVTRRILRKVRSVLRFMSSPIPEVPDYHVMTPVILPLYGSPTARRVNAWIVRQQVRVAARRIGFRASEAVVMVTIPTAWDVVAPLAPHRLVFNRSDLHSAFEETDQAMIRTLEDQLLSHSDAVLYTSHSLMELEAPLAGERAHFLDHGVDLERFGGGPAPVPDDVADLDGQVVGFFGGLDDYLVDFDLLRDVAAATPDATLLLVGDATGSMDELEALPNVRWLGFRPYELIPGYGARFDVALMPWQRNEWIEHCNPIKLKEYLALGLPVVSTDFPEVRRYGDVVAVAADATEFVALVRAALQGGAVGSETTRRARVQDSTWDAIALELLAVGEGPSPRSGPTPTSAGRDPVAP
jgi:GT2 family glycosyltransferase/glycosyltransferase involved in cell wall biosynthesis